MLDFAGFNKTVDEFYSSLESQKLSSRLTEREEAAKKKLDDAKNQHEKRLAGLQQVQELHIRKAQAIEANTHRVEEACAAVNGLVGQGMDWVNIGKLIENEQKRGNVVAQLIKLPLKLSENTVTLLLDEPGYEEEESDDEGDETASEEDSEDETVNSKKAADKSEKRLAIDIDLAESPYANARQYYDQKKTAAQKETKTIAASEKALKSMEKKTQTDLKKSLKQETQTLRATRKAFWFEKFLYFISSDGYLVLGGKDAQQNELLYRRYLKKGDIYVHADLHGASSVIIKNNPQTPDAPIPPSTLSQAGALSVCSSSAWDSKAVMAAWWVQADQVSKTAPTGEYLTTGGFIIRGQKNFLPPSQLLLGFASYWLVSESSRMNHNKNRIQRTESMMTGEAEMLADDARGLNISDDGHQSEDEHDDAVPDVEDTGESAEKEVQEDDRAADSSEDESDAEAEDEDLKQRKNPLQMNGRNENDDEPEEKIEIEQSETATADASQAQSAAGDTEGHTDQDHDDTTDEEQDGEPSTNSNTQAPSEAESNLSSSMKPLHPPTKQKQKQQPAKRGANTKAAKRRAAKYALQDEEDKALAMQLLGTTKAEQRKEAEEEAKAARQEKLEKEKERKRAQHQKAADAEKARQEKLAKQAERQQNGEVIDDDEDEVGEEQAAIEMQEHLNIDLLVPTPEPGDEIIAAIPVCAPWSALSRNKYKVKLQPGSMKKGKALKEIVGIWNGLANKGPKVVDEKNQDKERVWTREMELVKAWRVEEIVSVIPVKGVRITLGGGAGANTAGKGKTARGGKGSKKK